MQLSTKQANVTLGTFGPEAAHQHEMSHANKLAQLAYSKRAHSEWSLLHKWEADLEKLSVQERKAFLANMKVSNSHSMLLPMAVASAAHACCKQMAEPQPVACMLWRFCLRSSSKTYARSPPPSL